MKETNIRQKGRRHENSANVPLSASQLLDEAWNCRHEAPLEAARKAKRAALLAGLRGDLDTQMRAKALAARIDAHLLSPEKSRKLLMGLRAYFVRKKDVANEVQVLETMCRVALTYANHANVRWSIEELQKVSTRHRYSIGSCHALLWKTKLHIAEGEYSLALESSLQALDIAKKEKLSREESAAAEGIGAIYINRDELRLARPYLQASAKAAKQIGYMAGYAMALSNLARCDNSLRRPTSAIRYWRMAIPYLQTQRLSGEEALAHAGIAATLALQGHPAEADREINLAIEAVQHADTQQQIDCRILQAQTLTYLHRYDAAETIVTGVLKDLTQLSFPHSELIALRVLAQAKEGSGDLSGALAVQQQLLKRTEQRIRDERDEHIRKLELQLVRLRSEEEQRREEEKQRHMRQERELQLQRISWLSLQLIGRNEIISDIYTRLKGTASNRDRDQLLEHLRQLMGSSDNWNEFDQQLLATFSKFIQSLQKRSGALTRTEIKVACAMQLTSSTKEIAQLLNLSRHTVDTHRRHIRKKLQLGTTENLAAVLSSLAK